MMADDNPLLAGAPTWADAYSYNANELSNWVAQQRQISADRGLWNDQTGLPTAAGAVNAAGQYANALMMGTTAPGARAPTGNPEFSKWFSNSRVVNEAGEPLTVYHGTNADISQFDASLGKSKTDAPQWASFFTDDPALASSYAVRAGRAGANVVPAHLSLQNPIEATGRNWFALQSPLEGTVWHPEYGQYVTIRKGDEVDINMLSSMAKQAGYDGLIARNVPDAARPSDKARSQTTYVAFNPAQIKSAISGR